MRRTRLPFSLASIGEEEIAEVVDTLRSDWLTTGPKAAQFEQEFTAAVNAPAALALNSGTAALHVALAALGIGPGDFVVTTPMTFCSTVHVIEQSGARPILVDIEPDTLNIDSAKIKKAITESDSPDRIKAILPVHLYGHPCDMQSLTEIAAQQNLAIVEDAAHALPASFQGRIIGSGFSGSIPWMTCFSFYATKNLTTTEGGMLTGPTDLIAESRLWSLHGIDRDAWTRDQNNASWFYEVIRPGFKYNMTDLQAAIGLHQLRKLKTFHQRRREIAAQYNQAFNRFEHFELPAEREDAQHAWHLYVLRLRLERMSISRDQFIEELGARNIFTSVHFIPVHLHPYYRDKYCYRPESFPIAYHEYQRMISLPIYPRMSDGDVADVIEAVIEVAKKVTVRPAYV